MIVLALAAAAAVQQWTPVTYHEACFNGWAELADFSRSDADLAEWMGERCADTRLGAALWLRRSRGDTDGGGAAVEALRQLERTWVAANRANDTRRPARGKTDDDASN